MLLGYGGRNCWCFKEWININLRLNGHVPEKFSSNKSFSLITVFFGANASGKTSALKIYAFISYFITNSFSSAKESPIFNDSFFDNKGNSEFYVEFTDNSNTEYRYELILQREHVVEERLFLISNATEDIILMREDNNITVNKLFDNSIKLILRNNASIISTLHQYDIIEIDNIYSFFNNTFTNVVYTVLNYELDNKINKVSEIYYKDQGALAFASNLIRKFDTGISGIEIILNDSPLSQSLYYPVFSHDNLKELYKLNIHSESTGTKSLYINLLNYYWCIKIGGVLILDDFDINLHHDILPYLLKIFTENKSNPKNAQLLFTSLNPSVMDILGKYRTYLFEKEEGESYGYRLDEPETKILRNDRSKSEPYKRHYLGGYPKIEA